MAAAFLVGSAARSQESGSTGKENTGHYVPWIEARAGALRHNAAAISAATGGRKIVAVVKTNGYGLGDVAVATVLQPKKRNDRLAGVISCPRAAGSARSQTRRMQINESATAHLVLRFINPNALHRRGPRC